TVEKAQYYILKELAHITWTKQEVNTGTYTLLAFAYRVRSDGTFSLPVVDGALRILEGHIRRMHEPDMDSRLAELHQRSQSLRTLPRNPAEETLNIVQRLAEYIPGVTPEYWNKIIQDQASFEQIYTSIATQERLPYLQEALTSLLPDSPTKPFTPAAILADFQALDEYSALPDKPNEKDAIKWIDEHLLFHQNKNWGDKAMIGISMLALLLQLFQQASGIGLEKAGQGEPTT
ncbi:hypothetical protein MUP32_01040, partial [Candidatus Microgenomates bacterium]|nr:hypothetical protein [Candidatus Microgenomates bacterium]